MTDDSGASIQRKASKIVAIYVYNGATLLDIAGPLEVFVSANHFATHLNHDQAPVYITKLIGRHEGLTRTTCGVSLAIESSITEPGLAFDTLVIPGGGQQAIDIARLDKVFLEWLKEQEPATRRVCSVCTGAFLLAEAGLLAGRKATTHWDAKDIFNTIYPNIDLDVNAIFHGDGHIYTSAGVTAGMDLALALVEEDCGRRIALDVARQLVLYLKRPGGQAQFSKYLQIQFSPDSKMRDLLDWVMDNLDADLSIPALAERSAMSQRNFARIFTKDIGVAPARFIELLRLERARLLLEDSHYPLDQVAHITGFGNVQTMRRTFLKYLHVTPDEYRQHF